MRFLDIRYDIQTLQIQNYKNNDDKKIESSLILAFN